MKQLSSIDHGSGLQRLEHATDADAAGKVTVLTDLCAGTDRRPRVDHRPCVHVGAEIDEGRHQHHAGRDIGRAAHHAAGHGAEAGLLEFRRAPALELGIDFVPPHGFAGRAGDHAHVVEPERQQHGLFQPLIDLPGAAWLPLGHARLAAIEQFKRRIDRLAHSASGLRPDLVAALEGLVDDLGKLVVGHFGPRTVSAAGCRGPDRRCQAGPRGGRTPSRNPVRSSVT